jgi:hypothetical protein
LLPDTARSSIEHVFEGDVSEVLAPPRPDQSDARPTATLPPAVFPSPEVTQLRSELARVAAVDPVELPDVQALADARELLALREQLDAVLLRRIGDVDVRRLHRLDASPTTAAWIRRQDVTVDPSTITSRGASRGCPACRTPFAPAT